MTKVYVITKAKPLEEEVYVAVKASNKEAEKAIRALYPNARKDSDYSPTYDIYTCRDRSGTFFSMYVHEEII